MAVPDRLETPAPVDGAQPSVHWYSLDPRVLTRSRLIRALAIGLLLAAFSVVPLWRLLWYLPVYAAQDFFPVRDAHGKYRAAWHWIDGREIRIYQTPDIQAGKAEQVADGVRALLNDLRLNFTVRVLPMPANILAAYQASQTERSVNGERRRCVDFGQLEAYLIELRASDPHADMLVVNTPIAECWWAHGMATFTSGVSVLQEDMMNLHLGKHESAHLLGYLYHDSLPLYVLGYPWEGLPWNRDTLMVLYGGNDTLSPRARDALRYFWRGMEHRTGNRFLKD